MTPEELQAKIERHRQEIERLSKSAPVESAAALVAIQHSEIFVAASQLAEISGRRIVCLTKVVAIFTVVLVVLTAVLVFFTFKLVEYH